MGEARTLSKAKLRCATAQRVAPTSGSDEEVFQRLSRVERLTARALLGGNLSYYSLAAELGCTEHKARNDAAKLCLRLGQDNRLAAALFLARRPALERMLTAEVV